MKNSRAERESNSDGFGICSVGAWLKAAREERGVTLDEVANVTRIGKNYLEAIEEGATAKLPNQAYTRGFIRLYASHLGLSPQKALSMMDASPTETAETVPELPSNPEHIRRAPLAYNRSLILIATLILALASGYLLFKPARQITPSIQSDLIKASSGEQTVITPATPKQLSPPTSDSSPPPAAQQKNAEKQGFILRLKAVSDGKIHITIDGSVSQDYDLVTGDIVEWKAETSFILDLDNAASVEGELDGVKLNHFGEQGKAAHLVLKADGIHKE